VRLGKVRHAWLLSLPGELWTTRRTCRVSTGKSIVFAFPFASWCDTVPPFGDPSATDSQLRNCAIKSFNSSPERVSATLDGKQVRLLLRYTVVSPAFSFEPGPVYQPPPPAGTYRAVGVGIFLVFSPMSVGVHTFRWYATISGEGYSIQESSTYRFIVHPKSK
jgi:hypothetical protein